MSTTLSTPHATPAVPATGRSRPAGPAGQGGAGPAQGGQPATAFARLLQGLDAEAEAPPATAEASADEPATEDTDADTSAPGAEPEHAAPASRRRDDEATPDAAQAAANPAVPAEQRAAALGQAGWLAAARARAAQGADAAGRARQAAGAEAALAAAAGQEATLAEAAERVRSAAALGAERGQPADAALALDAPGWRAAEDTTLRALPALAEPGAAAPLAAEPALAALGEAAAPAAAAEAPPPAQATLAPPPGSAAFPGALGAQLRTWLQDGVEYATLELNPQDMGPIDVRIALRDGQTLVELGADVGATRQALAEALPALAEALGDVGLSLAGGSVADQTGQHARPGDGEAQRSFALPAWLAPAREGVAEPAPAPGPAPRGLVDLVA